MIHAKIELERKLLPNERQHQKLSITIQELATINTALNGHLNELKKNNHNNQNKEDITKTTQLLHKSTQKYKATKKQYKRTQKNDYSTKNTKKEDIITPFSPTPTEHHEDATYNAYEKKTKP